MIVDVKMTYGIHTRDPDRHTIKILMIPLSYPSHGGHDCPLDAARAALRGLTAAKLRFLPSRSALEVRKRGAGRSPLLRARGARAWSMARRAVLRTLVVRSPCLRPLVDDGLPGSHAAASVCCSDHCNSHVSVKGSLYWCRSSYLAIRGSAFSAKIGICRPTAIIVQLKNHRLLPFSAINVNLCSALTFDLAPLPQSPLYWPVPCCCLLLQDICKSCARGGE